MDRGVWWATVHGVTESDMTEQLILSLFTFMENREYLKADLRVKKSEYPFDALFELFLDSQVILCFVHHCIRCALTVSNT